jgi:hypothetical protein
MDTFFNNKFSTEHKVFTIIFIIVLLAFIGIFIHYLLKNSNNTTEHYGKHTECREKQYNCSKGHYRRGMDCSNVYDDCMNS